ncbi:hypothetical protein TIFTF001_022082 [Ficus carica]|uniref:Uncharacterized protein n=1 Tax=Ficus carica TaxID=3494 RepID=A0AA88ABV3_FICCA|nr:hypothetical protein TIFTF001_022082 [Ficus carica]
MEGVHRFIRNVSKDPKSVFSSSSSSSSFDNPRLNEGISAALPSSDQSRVLISRPPSWSGGGLHSETTCPALGLEAPEALER